MVGTVDEDETKIKRNLIKVVFDWLTDSSGDATFTTTEFYTGEVLAYIEIPDGGGTAPTTAYDVVVNNDDTEDILNGLGADVVTADGVQETGDSNGNPLLPLVRSKLNLIIDNAGNAKGGKTMVFIRGIKHLKE